jgi:phosphate acetyltransferase
MEKRFIDVIKDRARADQKTIVLPEPDDDRIILAAARALEEHLAKIIILGERSYIDKRAMLLGVNLSEAGSINPPEYEKLDEYVELLYNIRKNKGMTPEKAREELIENPLMFGVVMVKNGDADGMVGGASHTTADLIRPSLQVIKTAPGIKTVSTCMVLDVPGSKYGHQGRFMISDVGLNQNPNAEQLADIAKSTDKSYRDLIGDDPKIAMLSYSTHGSAVANPLVDKVVEATKIAHEKYPELNLEGELQADAAIVPDIAAIKCRESKVAGHANILIVPNIDVGNISYKLLQWLGGVLPFGPLLQGIAKPVNDLSRGCVVDDVVGVIAITAVQAQLNGKN